MAKSPNQKLKLLIIKDFMLRNSDEKHPVTIPQIIEEPARYDIKAEEKTEKNALDDDPDRNSGDGAAMVRHHFLDRQRHLVAVRRLGTDGCCLGYSGQPLLLRSCEIHLPGMPRGIQTHFERRLLGKSYADRPQADLHRLRQQGLLCGGLGR